MGGGRSPSLGLSLRLPLREIEKNPPIEAQHRIALAPKPPLVIRSIDYWYTISGYPRMGRRTIFAKSCLHSALSANVSF